MTVEVVQRVLRSWIAIEVLTPRITKDGGWNSLAADRGGRRLNRKADAKDGQALWRPPEDDDAPPWPLLPDPPPGGDEGAASAGDDAGPRPSLDDEAPSREPRPWYSVILGAIPAQDAFARLDAIFEDQTDEDRVDRKTTGHVIAASVVLDEWGVMAPDSLAIASFAWGVGHLLGGGAPADLAGWEQQEQTLKARFCDLLTPRGATGDPRSLTWRDLLGVSRALAAELGLPDELWILSPCAIETVAVEPPAADILSSFLLPDLGRVLNRAEDLPQAISSYLGLEPPVAPWDALSDRGRLSALLEPVLFPLGRWPGPGLHPLSLLQQAAVNAIVRDLKQEGLAAVNGPPGTGKTTLLRDIAAHVIVTRAERLAAIEQPWNGLGGLDLMDFAIVVASNNNAAVENISLELPVREKALDPSMWKDGGLDYFGRTATALLDLADDAPDEQRAWGLIAARLGRAENRRKFFKKFWWDKDWGLNDWLYRVAQPDNLQHRERPAGKLVELDPPPRGPEARADWRRARSDFQRALDRCRDLRAELEDLSRAGDRLRAVETQLPSARAERERLRLDHDSARKASASAHEREAVLRAQETAENTKLAALVSIRPTLIARLFRTAAWRSYEASVGKQLPRLNEIQQARKAAAADLAAAAAEEERQAAEHIRAEHQLKTLEADAAHLAQRLAAARADLGDSFPGAGFWSQPDQMFQRSSPWNGGRFREARDTLFAAAMRLHRAFIVAGARTLKPSLNAIVKATSGGADAPEPTARDWGVFFLLVPVVSTTFAAMGRMFQTLDAASIGWLLIDEAGQAAPQQAVGAIWRARRAVVIGDPLQIEPIAAAPQRTMQLIFQSNGADATPWSAPKESAQTLADRASPIQGRFPIENGGPGEEVRITGIPLLVHRRCERPMFQLANRIAYADRMVFATPAGASPIVDLLGESGWIDVDAASTDKWVEAEGRLIVRTIAGLCALLPAPPDLYVISPFRMPAARLRRLLLQTPGVLPGRPAKERQAWVEKRVGTVHTFQGKEAEAVILMLGAGRGAKPGSRNWAGGTPNLLNVAATRAKRGLYIVGNREAWQGAGVFSEAAQMLPVRSAENWLEEPLLASGSR